MLALVCVASPAWAEGDGIPQGVRDALLEELRAGRRAFETGAYEEARVRFQAARALHPLPSLWFLEAECLEKLDRPTQAITAFERFLKEAGEDPRREQAVRSIALLRRRLKDAKARLRVKTTPRGVQVILEGRGGPPRVSPVTLEGAGGEEVVVGLSLPGYVSLRRKVRLEAGRTLELEVTLLPKPGPRPVPTGVWVLGGVGVVGLLGGGAGLAVDGISGGQVDAYDARRQTPGSQRPADYDALVARHNTSLILGWSLLGVAALSTAGAIWWWQASRAGDAEVSWGLGPAGVHAAF